MLGNPASAGEAVDGFALALHETIANIVEHARPPEAIRLTLIVEGTPDGARLSAALRDRGRAMRAPSSDEDGEWWDSENRSRGRGLDICREVLDRFEYQRVDDENEWRLELEMYEPVLGAAAFGQADSDSADSGRFDMDARTDRVSVVREVNGRLDIATAADVGRELREGIVVPATHLVLRLGRVSFLDSSGLGMLVGLQKELTNAGGRLVLCEVPPQARMALRLTRLEWLLSSFETLEEATAA